MGGVQGPQMDMPGGGLTNPNFGTSVGSGPGMGVPSNPAAQQAIGQTIFPPTTGGGSSTGLISDIQNAYAPISSGAPTVSNAANPWESMAGNAYSGLSTGAGSNLAQQAINPWATGAQQAYGPLAQGTGMEAATASVAPFTGASMQGYSPFTQGDLGNSPATQAAIQRFQQNTLPIIQNQMQLQGLGNGPAVADVAGRSLAAAMPQFIQNDLSNRLMASQGIGNLGSQLALPATQLGIESRLQGGQGLANIGSNLALPATQTGINSRLAAGQGLAGIGSGLAIPSAQADVQNRLAAGAGLTGLGSNLVMPAWQAQMNQQANALNALQGGGQTLQGMQQNIFDAQQAEMLRLQGLAESGTYGAFGSQTPTVRTQSSGGK